MRIDVYVNVLNISTYTHIYTYTQTVIYAFLEGRRKRNYTLRAIR